MNLIDRAVSYLAPTYALSRMRSRRILELGGGYRRGRGSRLISTASGGGADYHLESMHDRRRDVDKARDLVRNNSYAEAVLARHSELVVGETGIMPRPMHPSEAVRDKQKQLFKAWCRPENCTVRGMSSWPQLQRLLVRSRCQDGDVGVIRRSTGKLQPFMSDELANPRGHEWDPMFRDGVELGASGEPRAFHLAVTDSLTAPNRRYSSKHIRVPRRHVSFLTRRMSEDQTRGVNVFVQNFHLYEHLDKLIEAVVVSARMAACYGLLITTPHGRPDGGHSEVGADGIARQLEKIWPGMVQYLELGEEATQLNPTQSLEKLQDSLTPLLRTIGLPLGLSLEFLLMDLTKMNYTVSRSLAIQTYRVIGPEQCYLVEHLCDPTWVWLNRRWIAEGELPADEQVFLVDWVKPARPMVDPLKDLQAHALALDLCLNDEDAIAQSLNIDLSAVMEKRAQILERKRKLGLPVLLSTQTRDAGQKPADDEESSEDTEESENEDENKEDPEGDEEDEE